MKGIIQRDKECFLCRTLLNGHNPYGLEEHHIFKGRNRQKSEQYGLKVWLCHEHHRRLHGMHGHELDLYLQKIGQMKFEESETREEFRREFGKSYL